ncbi:MAG TPA: GDP-mannose 4,6-dehydratase [Thermoanaerobaculia bacterium]|nr:GDP-mannose 4,6-dehydratase [Thermoanaerobaculia bacterium]
MRILVTGVSGFLGRHLARRLVAAGHEVHGSCLCGHPVPGATVHPMDLLAEGAVAALVARVRPRRIVHLAGLAHVGASWQRMAEYFAVNVLGTERLVAAVGETPIVFASSAEVYGVVPAAEQPIAESREAAPASPYALTKAAAELLVRPRGVVARLFNLVGPGQSQQFALPTFARQLAAIAAGDQEPLLAVGNLAARRDFLHVDDGASALVTLVERGQPGETYNVASGRAVSMGEALDALLAASGLRVRVEVDPARLRPLDVPELCGSPARMAALGWRPERSLEEAVADLWRATYRAGEDVPRAAP